jgi:dCTP diphosphatase
MDNPIRLPGAVFACERAIRGMFQPVRLNQSRAWLMPPMPSMQGMSFTSRDLENIRQDIARFATDRDWDQFHSPRNLLLAAISEMGELAELVRWAGDSNPSIPAEKQQQWADEMADVFILLVRLADRSGVDLTLAFERKLRLASEKYPADKFRGSNRKYDEG